MPCSFSLLFSPSDGGGADVLLAKVELVWEVKLEGKKRK